MEQQELTRDPWMPVPVRELAEQRKRREDIREQIGPTVDEKHLASKLGALERETHKAEALRLPEQQTGQDGDSQIHCQSPQTPAAEGTIPWEEPGRDD